MERLKDKVALFIGGGSSVGSVALRHYLEEGAKVVLVDVDEKYFDRTKELREAYPDATATFVGACTVQEDMDKAAAFTKEKYGRIDILINFAGFHGSGHTQNIVPEQWNLAMNVTCTGAYRGIMAVLPYMKEQKGGHIVNFTSLGGRGNRGVAVSYAAWKAGCTGMTKAFAELLAPYNISVTSFAPGTLDTKQFERIPEKGSVPFKMPPGGLPGMPGYKGPVLYSGQSVIKDRPIATLDEIAGAMVYLGSDESAYLTGDCVDMNGGILMQT